MPQTSEQTLQFLNSLKQELNIRRFSDKLKNGHAPEKPLPERVPLGNDHSVQGLEQRRNFLREAGCCPEHICTAIDDVQPEDLKGSIENFIGFTHIPVGVMGPLRVRGLFADGDYYIPLATTEGAMIASYNRGAHVVSRNGGVTSICISESISRAPAFIFNSVVDAGLFIEWALSNIETFKTLAGETTRHGKLVDAGLFIEWALSNIETFKALAGETTRHGKLVDVRPALNSNMAFLIFEYETGDASGQNMVTVATERICRWIEKETPYQPRTWYVEGNLSGDKKATMLSFLTHRGRKVVAEAVIKRKSIERFLHTTPEAMAEYCLTSTIGGVQSGSIGVQGHYANALAALFLCCGQDVACLSEASVGITTMQVNDEGDLYVSVSLPNLTVGTVGGGTYLPTARDCLRMLDCEGSGNARKFAEICAATVLAGEVSIIAALSCGDFAKAHTTFRHKSE